MHSLQCYLQKYIIYCKYNGFNIAVGYLKYCRYYRNDCISHLELIHNIIKFQTEWNRWSKTNSKTDIGIGRILNITYFNISIIHTYWWWRRRGCRWGMPGWRWRCRRWRWWWRWTWPSTAGTEPRVSCPHLLKAQTSNLLRLRPSFLQDPLLTHWNSWWQLSHHPTL